VPLRVGPLRRLARAGSADPRRWAALVVMLVAAFMNLLDVSIVNIAIPPIQHGLRDSRFRPDAVTSPARTPSQSKAATNH
jgi:hypothetical protein